MSMKTNHRSFSPLPITIELMAELYLSAFFFLLGAYLQFVAVPSLPWHVLAYSVGFATILSALIGHWLWGDRPLSMFKVVTLCILSAVIAMAPISWYLKYGESKEQLQTAMNTAMNKSMLVAIKFWLPALGREVEQMYTSVQKIENLREERETSSLSQ